MARTRSKPKPQPTTTTTTSTSTPTPTTTPLPPSTPNPPKLFVLPRDVDPSSRIVTLANPATGDPSRYLFDPQKGFFEFTRIAAPKKACRSWLLTSAPSSSSSQAAVKCEGEDEASSEREEENAAAPLGTGYTTQSPDLYLATPIDALFLLLPALAPPKSSNPPLFHALDSHLETLASTSPHWASLHASHTPSLESLLLRRLTAVCDTVDAGAEVMFRLSETKLRAVLMAKAQRMASRGLPASLDEKFVRVPLVAPVQNEAREVAEPVVVVDDDDAAVETAAPDTEAEAEKQINYHPLLTLHTALSHLQKSYLPPRLHTPLSTHPTFTTLQTHLTRLRTERQSSAAQAALTHNALKRSFDDEDGEAMEREEKRAKKKEEEERRKKSQSRGVKLLKKADVSGMRKMSDFFGRKAAVGK